jgi:hypothetical protein
MITALFISRTIYFSAKYRSETTDETKLPRRLWFASTIPGEWAVLLSEPEKQLSKMRE